MRKPLAIIAIMLVVAAAFYLKSRTYKAMPEAVTIYESAVNTGQAENRDRFILFKPAAQNRGACFIFYPGALVDELSYAPLMKDIADQGFPAYLMSMPFDIAFFSVDAADHAKRDAFAKQYCERFVLAGHSQGGAAASIYLASHPDDVLLLVASYPSKKHSLAEHLGSVISIFGSNDGLISADEIESTKALLPGSVEVIKIDGANHAQFGWYGEQKGDHQSTISRDEQQRKLLAAALKLLR